MRVSTVEEYDLLIERVGWNKDPEHSAEALKNTRLGIVAVDSRSNKTVGMLLNGWTLAPVFYAFSGSPYSAGLSVSGAGGAGGVNQSGGTSRFPLLPRNSFRRPRIVNFDMRLSRRFKFNEGTALELLAEGFNVFNRTQVTNVNSTLYTQNFSNNTFTFNTPFQSITETGATLFRERQVQFAVRFEF